MKKTYITEDIEKFPKEIYLDKQKDIRVIIYKTDENDITYQIYTPNNKNDKLLRNLSKDLQGEYSKENRNVEGIFENLFNDGNIYTLSFSKFEDIEIDLNKQTISFPEIPVAEKVIISQKEGAYLPKANYLEKNNYVKTDIHSHYTAMLEPEKLVALGLKHNIDYHLYYIYTLGLDTKTNQENIKNSIRDALKKSKENKGESNQDIEKEVQDIFDKLEQNKGNIREVNKILPNDLKKNATIPFKDLVLKEGGKDNLRLIMDSCCLSRERQSNFEDMMNTYRFRYPFTNGDGNGINENIIIEVEENQNIPVDIKDLFQTMCEDRKSPDFQSNNLQDDTLLWIARNAREEGVEYIEMSHNALSSKNNQATLDLYERNLDKLEKLTGVKLRFLAGISRSTDENRFPEIEKNIQKALKSQYVVGFDVLGEELNSTNYFAPLLNNMTKYALEQDPNMVIRVHSGESYSFKDNVFKVIETVYSQYLEQLEKSEEPLNVPKPNLRIGHGIYGLEEEMQKIDSNSKMGHIIKRLSELNIIDNKEKESSEMNLLDFMSQMDIVIERCLSSNILLSHQNALGKDPLKTYLNHNVKCVLATDGYGVYGTSSQIEVLLATTSGIGQKSIQKIRETEEYVISKSLERDDKRIEQENIEVIEYNQKSKKETDNLNAKQDFLPISNVDEFPQDENAIIIAGGSYNTFDKNGKYSDSIVKPEDIEILNALLNVVDSKQDRFVIGGRLSGQELKLIEMVNKKNKQLQDEKIEIILVTESNEELNKQYQNLSETQQEIVKNANIRVLQSYQKELLANYKKINEEIFSQNVNSNLIVLDGGQAVGNLMSDANKGDKNRIFSKDSINEFIQDKINALDNVTILETQKIEASQFFKNAVANKNLVGKSAIDDVDRETEERNQEIDEKQVEGVNQR